MTGSRAVTHICGYDTDAINIRGRDLVQDLMGRVSFTEMFLLQGLGETPSPLAVTIVEAVMVTMMEHGLVPSAMVSRLTLLGAPESIQGAVAAGLLGVGDRYAGTAAECGELLERLMREEPGMRAAAVEAEIRRHRENRRPLPGFGHPIHRERDPRVTRLIAIAKDAGAKGDHIELVEQLEQALEQSAGRKLPVNVSAALAAVLGEAGIPSRMMRGIVLTARCAGLVGHVLEESRQPAGDAMWKAAEAAVDYEPEKGSA